MSDQSYYRRRAEEEQDAADRAADPGVSQVHREMARRYRQALHDHPGPLNGVRGMVVG